MHHRRRSKRRPWPPRDTATTDEDTAVISVDVLANDTDVDGDTLTVAL